MRHDRITHYTTLASAAETPAELERILGEAHAELTESEYNAFLAKAISAPNIAAESQADELIICPRCGSDNIDDVIDYHDMGQADMFRCLDCEFSWEETTRDPAEKL